MNEINTLTQQIRNKNQELEALNLKYKKMDGTHKHQIGKLEDDIVKLKDDHQRWIEKQDAENQDWNRERSELKEQVHNLNLKYQENQKKNRHSEDDLTKQLEDKRLEIASLNGTI